MASGDLRHHRLDIADIYAKFRDIVSRSGRIGSRDDLAVLSKSLELREQSWDATLHDIFRLMSMLDLSADSHQFNCFYNFVFFICREYGQKSLSVSRAIAAWKLVLNGRFRLLSKWCDFVEKHQRHNISEDTWQQLLAFSRCVNEDLEGYDPKGAWPLLIDDFVEHLYRISQANNCNTRDISSTCDDMETQTGISSRCTGLNLHPGSKRKFLPDFDMHNVETLKSSENLILLMKPKRIRHVSAPIYSDIGILMQQERVRQHSRQ